MEEIAASQSFPVQHTSSPIGLVQDDNTSSRPRPPLELVPATTGPRPRRVEIGFVQEVSQEGFFLIFERTPVWILALEPTMCSRVHIGGFTGLADLTKGLMTLGYDHTLFSRAIVRLAKDCVRYCAQTDEPPGSTVLISGSYPYLKQAATQVRLGKVLYLLDEHWKGKKTPLPSNGITWQRLKPTQFGGSTHYPVLVGTSGFTFSPLRSALDRNIGHILDHGIRPNFLASSSVALLGTQSSPFYLSESLLDPHSLQRPVAYTTSYSAGNWGSRVLSHKELGVAFGLPTLWSTKGR